MNYEILKTNIIQTHQALQMNAMKAVNKHLTLRNWIIGFYIVEYEQNGEDRAKYGSHLLVNLANDLDKKKVKGLTAPELSRTRQFYSSYPSIFGTLTRELIKIQNFDNSTNIFGSPTQEFKSLNALFAVFQPTNILGSPTQEFDTERLSPEIIHQRNTISCL